uniref:Uncharacterized protein n=1 Tax=Amphimedon queenslandica TaxID=400682 RepID=A0A1X7VT47_AMPQE
NRYGSIERDEFCAFGIGHVGNGDPPNGGGNGSENETPTQGTNNECEGRLMETHLMIAVMEQERIVVEEEPLH